MNVYCINLDRRPDRLRHMSARLGELGIAFERVPAVDGTETEVRAAAARRGPGMNGLRIGPGTFGCFESHRECWKRLLADGASHALVLEDDMFLSDDLPRFVRADWIPKDADIVKIETANDKVHVSSPMPESVHGRHLRRLRSRHRAAGAYVVSRDAAGRLLEATEGFVDPVDECLFNPASDVSRRLKVYQIFPALVVQAKNEDRTGGPEWTASSISERFAAEDQDKLQALKVRERRKRRGLGRLVEAVGHRLFALVAGTVYGPVPFR